MGSLMRGPAALALVFAGCAGAQVIEHAPAPKVFIAGKQEMADSLNPEASSAFVSIYEGWKEDASQRIGRRSRPPAAAQGPFPACFATAASLAIDMKQCVDAADPEALDPHCPSMPDRLRASSLWIARAGRIDGKDANEVMLPLDGGSALASLSFALSHPKIASEAQCHWIMGKGRLGYEAQEQALIERGLGSAREAKSRQMEIESRSSELKGAYLSKYWEAKWAKSMGKALPELAGKLDLAKKEDTPEKALGRALWDAQCDGRPMVDSPKMDIARLPASRSWRENWAAVSALIKARREPILSLCLDQPMPSAWGDCKHRHAMLAIGATKFAGKDAQDFGLALWILNSWGERWQANSRDGWVRAEPIMHRLQGEIIWLERPGESLPEGLGAKVEISHPQRQQISPLEPAISKAWQEP